jgi:hypothetical protein
MKPRLGVVWQFAFAALLIAVPGVAQAGWPTIDVTEISRTQALLSAVNGQNSTLGQIAASANKQAGQLQTLQNYIGDPQATKNQFMTMTPSALTSAVNSATGMNISIAQVQTMTNGSPLNVFLGMTATDWTNLVESPRQTFATLVNTTAIGRIRSTMGLKPSDPVTNSVLSSYFDGQSLQSLQAMDSTQAASQLQSMAFYTWTQEQSAAKQRQAVLATQSNAAQQAATPPTGNTSLQTLNAGQVNLQAVSNNIQLEGATNTQQAQAVQAATLVQQTSTLQSIQATQNDVQFLEAIPSSR